MSQRDHTCVFKQMIIWLTCMLMIIKIFDF